MLFLKDVRASRKKLHRLKKLLLKKQKQKTRNNYLLRLCGSC
jgi:hypothetical protein